MAISSTFTFNGVSTSSVQNGSQVGNKDEEKKPFQFFKHFKSSNLKICIFTSIKKMVEAVY